MDISEQKYLMNIALSKPQTPNPSGRPSASLTLRRSPRFSPNSTHEDEAPGIRQRKEPRPSTSMINKPQMSESSDDSESEESDGDGLITGPIMEEDSLAGALVPKEVTLRDIHFQRKLLTAMEKRFRTDAGKSTNAQVFTDFEIPDQFTQPGKNKVETAPGS
ncbi:uncharacterized protein LOC135171435 [Diachasmimorpha longicaudata]|uniref:uncharacterized protein LOC135171435 n=1 Tax=Diachasmimorpha longicaudata TaxID=58733 RepID=UPI0030B86B8C